MRFCSGVVSCVRACSASTSMTSATPTRSAQLRLRRVHDFVAERVRPANEDHALVPPHVRRRPARGAVGRMEDGRGPGRRSPRWVIA